MDINPMNIVANAFKMMFAFKRGFVRTIIQKSLELANENAGWSLTMP
jgi:hypothetical protein